MKVGLVAILPSIVIIVIMFFLRKSLNNWMKSLSEKLPENARFIVPPIIATIVFSLAWSWYHIDTSGLTGIIPNRIFPAIVGLFTYSVIQFGPKIQNSMASFFRARDKVPIFFRYVLVLAIPMGIALLITIEERVTAEALKEQFVVIIALIAAYLLVSPLIEKQSADSGLTPASRGFAGRTAVIFLLAVFGGFLVRILADILHPGVALADDCSSEWDCQQTSGYNAATATGGGAIGGAAGTIGSQLGEGPGDGGAAGAGGGAGAAAAGGGDGAAARNWMLNEGFLNPDGTITDKFRTWWSQFSSGSPDPTRMEAIAADSIDLNNGRINGDIVIIVRDRDTIPHNRPPAPAGAGAQVVTENYAPGVDITGTHDFIEHTRNYLNTLSNTQAGQDLLQRIMVDGAGGGHNVNIVDPGGNNGNSASFTGNGELQPDGSHGPGCNSTVNFNPYRHSLAGSATLPDGSPDPADWRNRPPDVGLHHELNHAWHASTGSIDTTPAPNPVVGGNTNNEELRTVSLGPFSGDPLDENAYRSNRGLVNRPFY
jgi:hypothetical protein